MRYERHAWHYRPWLARHFEEHGDRQAALELWRRQFEASPTLETYQTLQKLAVELGTWEQLRSALLSVLDPLRHASLLLDIALAEEDVDRALEIAHRPGSMIDQGRWEHLAQAAEAHQPRAALNIYRWLGERAIAVRGRGSYQIAAGYLRRVRALHQRLGETADWEAYITHLRQEHRRLHALQEELDKAGL